MARSKKKNFGNELDEPLSPNLYRYGGLGDLKHEYDAALKISIDKLKKLELLLDFYGLDLKDSPSCWILLSLHLASEYVEGFKIGKPPTLKKVQSMEAYLFYIAIQEIIETRKLSIDNAIKFFHNEVSDKLTKGIDFRNDLSREFKQIKKENFVISMFENAYSELNCNKFEMTKKACPEYKETAFLYALQ